MKTREELEKEIAEKIETHDKWANVGDMHPSMRSEAGTEMAKLRAEIMGCRYEINALPNVV